MANYACKRGLLHHRGLMIGWFTTVNQCDRPHKQEQFIMNGCYAVFSTAVMTVTFCKWGKSVKQVFLCKTMSLNTLLKVFYHHNVGRLCEITVFLCKTIGAIALLKVVDRYNLGKICSIQNQCLKLNAITLLKVADCNSSGRISFSVKLLMKMSLHLLFLHFIWINQDIFL